MPDTLAALHASVDRLATVAGPLAPEQLTASAYPSEWTIADTLSHVGSGAVIFRRVLDDALAGVETPGEAFPAVWDEWNAKSPVEQGADALVADRNLLDRLESLGHDERDRFHASLGPMSVGWRATRRGRPVSGVRSPSSPPNPGEGSPSSSAATPCPSPMGNRWPTPT